MDLSEKDKFERQKRGEDHLTYQPTNLSAQWQFGNPSSSTYQGNQMSDSPCPSVSMVGSFCPSLWHHSTNVQTSVNGSNSAPIGKPVVTLPRLDIGSIFLPASPNVLPPSLSHFPIDSAFVERAARLSSFNGGSFTGMVSPSGKSESLSPYSNTSRSSPKNSWMPTPSVSNSECVMKDQRDKGSLCSKESLEPDFSGIGREGTPNFRSASGDSSSRDLGSKRRKRTCQEMELEPEEETSVSPSETSKENAGGKPKNERKNSTKATLKPTGKQSKESMETPKQDYIHMRAPRGQATNSHSLAERVRREKISERMKYLQDLVPGCSKVTGKAVMLDEIINYVQSLQRQVEFLSMKLATVNPRLDYNIEGILPKDFLARDGSSSAMGFSNDMIQPPSHIAQLGLIPSAITYPSDAMKRALSAQLTMMPNSWDDEINNVFQMNFSTTNPPLNPHELSGIRRDGFPN